ncbi:LPXTG cell wall anchor domain-containing protein [Streptomyces sp. SID3343]|uniref:LPXTG cell wall anchor domain-containing protein n=1 Tax=Streptomyces sp. SID3343 TaxID=2690260 RepID=UPI00136AEDE7|nr:LPXTG cell wall anchor domain-containing protein [Streptomyces sp. SID3343]MYW01504.1 LPXTG cell wall anchor domain-containing protein [Streptomyces sp. SID3343]
MQLRRSLAATAVAAMVSSVALFAAPAAMAVESTPPATPSTTASPSTGASTTPSTSAPATPAKPDTDKPADRPATTPPATQPQVKSDAKAPSGQAETWPNPEKGNGPAIKLVGLPGSFVAGGDAASFKASITNDKGKDLEFIPTLVIMNDAGSLRGSHLKLEYKDPKTGQWRSAHLEDVEERGGNAVGAALGDDEDVLWQLKSKATVDIELRLAFTDKAPVGKSLAFYFAFSGAANGSDFYTSMSDGYIFTIAAPGKTVPKTEYKPKPPAQPTKKPAAKPAGKPGKELAATGADDSNTPVLIGAAAGTALVAGAGFLVFSRRRRNGSAA